MVLFSETLKSLLCIILIASYLSYGNVLPAFIYTLLVFAMALVYGYYRMREWEFNPIEIEEKNEEHSTTDSVEKEEEIKEEEKTKEEMEPMAEASEPGFSPDEMAAMIHNAISNASKETDSPRILYDVIDATHGQEVSDNPEENAEPDDSQEEIRL